MLIFTLQAFYLIPKRFFEIHDIVLDILMSGVDSSNNSALP